MNKINFYRIVILGLFIIIFGNIIRVSSPDYSQAKIDNVLLEQKGAKDNSPYWAVVDIFDDYKSWPSSTDLRQDDYMKYVMHYVTDPNDGQTGRRHEFADINGDGLIDLLATYFWSDEREQIAVFLNAGNMNFSVGYKCVLDFYNNIFYGDCADV